MAESKIEWTTFTFNPWIGCTRVSPACDKCYAADMAQRRKWATWGPGEPRRRTAESTWRQPLSWDRKVVGRPWTERTVFCASLADVFDNEVDPAWREDLFTLMRSTPNLVWLLLTKRIGNAVEMSIEAGGLPRNAALGATMANQDEWWRDARKLANADLALDPLFTFASVEPMLSAIDLRPVPLPDWVICGGESGSSPRMMDEFWAESLKLQVMNRNRAFFMKQMTAKAPIPDSLMVRQFPVLRR